jgi:hypothetical protein
MQKVSCVLELLRWRVQTQRLRCRLGMHVGLVLTPTHFTTLIKDAIYTFTTHCEFRGSLSTLDAKNRNTAFNQLHIVYAYRPIRLLSNSTSPTQLTQGLPLLCTNFHLWQRLPFALDGWLNESNCNKVREVFTNKLLGDLVGDRFLRMG